MGKGEQSYQRLPPQVPELEAAVIGGCLLSEETLEVISDLLRPGDFYQQRHRLIWEAMCRMKAQNRRADLLTVPEELKKAGNLDQAGGVYYLAELVEGVSSAAGCEYYAEAIREKSRLRGVIQAATEAIDDAYRADADSEKLIDALHKSVMRLDEGVKTGDILDNVTVMERVVQTLEEWRSYKIGEMPGVPTGFSWLDENTGGMRNGDGIYVLARPTIGKTSFLLDVARHAARNGYPAGIFSYESDVVMNGLRWVAQEAQMNTHFHKVQMYSEEEMHKLIQTAGKLSDLPVYCDEWGTSMQDFARKARIMVKRKGVRMIGVDYLQIMPLDKENTVEQTIAGASRFIKSLARELNIPIMVLSQMRRQDPTIKNPGMPTLSEGRGSGAIEQDADNVFALHRKVRHMDPVKLKKMQDEAEEAAGKGDNGPMREYNDLLVKAHIGILKQRNGPTGVKRFNYFEEWTSFRNYERESGED